MSNSESSHACRSLEQNGTVVNLMAEMAAMTERVSDAAEPMPYVARRLQPVFCSAPSLRKSISTPLLPSLDGAGMEVYVSLLQTNLELLSGNWAPVLARPL